MIRWRFFLYWVVGILAWILIYKTGFNLFMLLSVIGLLGGIEVVQWLWQNQDDRQFRRLVEGMGGVLISIGLSRFPIMFLPISFPLIKDWGFDVGIGIVAFDGPMVGVGAFLVVVGWAWKGP